MSTSRAAILIPFPDVIHTHIDEEFPTGPPARLLSPAARSWVRQNTDRFMPKSPLLAYIDTETVEQMEREGFTVRYCGERFDE